MSSEIIRATHRAPVKLGADLSIDGLVLPGGEAVLTTRGILGVLASSKSTNLGAMIEAIPLGFKPDLASSKRTFRMPDGRAIADGYTATALTTICRAYLAARRAGKLHHKQLALAARSEAVLDVLADIGITSLIYAATGFVIRQGQQMPDAGACAHLTPDVKHKALQDAALKSAREINKYVHRSVESVRQRCIAHVCGVVGYGGACRELGWMPDGMFLSAKAAMEHLPKFYEGLREDRKKAESMLGAERRARAGQMDLSFYVDKPGRVTVSVHIEEHKAADVTAGAPPPANEKEPTPNPAPTPKAKR